jgi:hypothetical protein
MKKSKHWQIQVLGNENSSWWEISVINDGAAEHYRGYGWFDAKKLLVGHSGGPCRDRVCEMVWDGLMDIARLLCDEMNGINK